MRVLPYKGRHLIPEPYPLAGPVVATAAAAVLVTAPPARAGTYEVRSGDTLSGIADRHGISTERLADRNDISDPDMIFAGYHLRVPGSGRRGGGGPSKYLVRAGETLSSLAADNGTTVDVLARANNIRNVNLIIVGEPLVIPTRGASSSTQSSAPAASTIEGMLEQQAAVEGVRPELVKAVAWQESGWQQDVVSSAGAIGVMQVMPDTGDYVNFALGGDNLDIRNAADNIEAGVRYLDHVINDQPTERKGLAAYYTGPGNVGRRLSKIQKTYVNSVQALARRF